MHPAFKIGALGALLLALGAAVAWAAEPASVKVRLGENAAGKMALTLSTEKIKAGTVEFEVANVSKELMHEFLITPWQGNPAALPYDAKSQQVKEDDLPELQGMEDMPAGTKATLRLVLHAGSYVVFCDQPGHYKAGMFRRFTVVR